MFSIRGASKQFRPRAPANNETNRFAFNYNENSSNFAHRFGVVNMNPPNVSQVRAVYQSRQVYRGNADRVLVNTSDRTSVAFAGSYYEPPAKKIAFEVTEGNAPQPKADLPKHGAGYGHVNNFDIVPNHYELQREYAGYYRSPAPPPTLGSAAKLSNSYSKSSSADLSRTKYQKQKGKLFVLNGSVKKVYEWLRGGVRMADAIILFSVYAKFQEVLEDSISKVRFTVTDCDGRSNTLIMACVYYTMDQPFPIIEPGEYVRCVVRLPFRGLFQCVSISQVTTEEFYTVQKLQFLSEKTAHEIMANKLV